MRAMRFSHVGATEFQLEAELHHHYAMNGAPYPAYGTIVGSGDNANILHYTQNSDVLSNGDLVLIDSGCELQGYAAVKQMLVRLPTIHPNQSSPRIAS